MADQIDSVQPANIGPEYNGLPAARITVLADRRGQCFDVSDVGNASASSVALAVEWRFSQHMWSVCYVNQSGEEGMTQALTLVGLGWTDARYWPRRGAYMWAADPSGNIAAGRWVPPVTPLMVQDRYVGAYDLSRTAGAWPGRVAGYMDGVDSAWPASAWDRFATIPDVGSPQEVLDAMNIGNDAAGNLIVVGAAPASDPSGAGNLLVFTQDKATRQWDVMDVTDAIKAQKQGTPDTRTYQVV